MIKNKYVYIIFKIDLFLLTTNFYIYIFTDSNYLIPTVQMYLLPFVFPTQICFKR